MTATNRPPAPSFHTLTGARDGRVDRPVLSRPDRSNPLGAAAPRRARSRRRHEMGGGPGRHADLPPLAPVGRHHTAMLGTAHVADDAPEPRPLSVDEHRGFASSETTRHRLVGGLR